MRSVRNRLRVLGLAILAVVAAGGPGRAASAAEAPALVERAAASEAAAMARRPARIAPRRRRAPRSPSTARPSPSMAHGPSMARWSPSIARAPRRSPVVVRAAPPWRPKSPTYVVHRALLR